MGLRARLPFTETGADFKRYYDAMAKALGYKPSSKHLRVLRINKAGTRAYDRKVDLG